MSKLKKIFLYSMLFIYICGSCNYGLTKIYPVLPLILPILFLVRKDLGLLRRCSCIIVVGFLMNLTIFYNPLFFPALLNPVFYVKKDCILKIYSDKSSAFISVEEKEGIDTSSQRRIIKKGTSFPIEKIYTFGGIDSQNKVYIESKDFHFSPDDNFIEAKLPIENPVLKYVGHIIIFPIMFEVAVVQLLSYFSFTQNLVQKSFDFILRYSF